VSVRENDIEERKGKMKKRVLIALMVTTGLVLSMLLVTAVGANPTYVLLDSVNIGNTTSEMGHSLTDWTNVWSGCGWCGPDGNMRLIWGDGGDTCVSTENWASFTLNAGTGVGKTLKMSHLEGAADDGFNIYVNDTLVATDTDTHSSNTWLTEEFDISPWGFSGLLTIKLEATAGPWGGCSTYGQVAFDMIELHGSVLATIDIDPDTLNLRSKGSFVTAYIELPAGFDVSLIDVASVKLNSAVTAEVSPTAIGDYDADGVPDLMVKFDRGAVQDTVEAGDSVEVTITGQVNGIDFEGTDTIRVIDKGKEHTSGDASSVVY
jgi:hypothetical protein